MGAGRKGVYKGGRLDSSGTRDCYACYMHLYISCFLILLFIQNSSGPEQTEKYIFKPQISAPWNNEVMQNELKSTDIYHAFIKRYNVIKGTKICHLKICLCGLCWANGHWKPAEVGKALKTRHRFSLYKGNFHL